jgi:hypothetical protein
MLLDFYQEYVPKESGDRKYDFSASFGAALFPAVAAEMKTVCHAGDIVLSRAGTVQVMQPTVHADRHGNPIIYWLNQRGCPLISTLFRRLIVELFKPGGDSSVTTNYAHLLAALHDLPHELSANESIATHLSHDWALFMELATGLGFLFIGTLCFSMDDLASRETPDLGLITRASDVYRQVLICQWDRRQVLTNDSVSVTDFARSDFSRDFLWGRKHATSIVLDIACGMAEMDATMILNSQDFLFAIVSTIDASQLLRLSELILQHRIALFAMDPDLPSIFSVFESSLAWDTFEQITIWQLLLTHIDALFDPSPSSSRIDMSNMPTKRLRLFDYHFALDLVKLFLPKLSPTDHPEAIGGVMSVLARIFTPSHLANNSNSKAFLSCAKALLDLSALHEGVVVTFLCLWTHISVRAPSFCETMKLLLHKSLSLSLAAAAALDEDALARIRHLRNWQKNMARFGNVTGYEWLFEVDLTSLVL